jgi:3-polyprenyl-4-hydroxybenzoate decarboxylase
MFPLVMPQVKDLWSYGETGFHALAAAVVHERYERESLQSAFRILGEGQLALTKFLLLLDTSIDLTDFRRVLEAVLARADFSKDLFIFSNTAMDTLDYSGPKVNHGSKGVLLGCGEPKRDLPREYRGTPPTSVRKVCPFCAGCLVVEVESFDSNRKLAAEISTHASFGEWPLIAVVDDLEATLSSTSAFLWTVFTRFEPAADVYAAGTNVHRHHLSYTPPIVIDARFKPWYPAVVECDVDTQRLVDRRWREYFPAGSSE